MADEEGQEEKEPAINYNKYSTKKTIAAALLDIALLTSNSTQLKYVLQTGYISHPFYTLMISLISISIILQVSCGVCLIMVGTTNINKEMQLKKADAINNFITVQILFITIVNILISGFGIEHAVQIDLKRSILEQTQRLLDTQRMLENQRASNSIAYYRSIVRFDDKNV